MIPSYIHFLANDIVVFFFMVKKNLTVCMFHILVLCPSVDGALGWFHNLAAVKSDAFTRVCKDFCGMLTPSGIQFRRSAAVSYARPVCSFVWFLFWNLRTDFHRGWIYLLSPWRWIKDSFSSQASTVVSFLLIIFSLGWDGIPMTSSFSWPCQGCWTFSPVFIGHSSFILWRLPLVIASLTVWLFDLGIFDLQGSLYVPDATLLSSAHIAKIFVSFCGHLFP